MTMLTDKNRLALVLVAWDMFRQQVMCSPSMKFLLKMSGEKKPKIQEDEQKEQDFLEGFFGFLGFFNAV